MKSITDLLSLLAKHHSPEVFNPWRDVDSKHDLGDVSPLIRKTHLEHFLQSRLKSARYCLLGEALSYQGGHFSGIAMMSERILLGHCRNKGMTPEMVLPGFQAKRSSKPEIQPLGFAEPTATMVWGLISQSGIPATQFITWNSFAWHPYNPAKGILSNRRPSLEESRLGLPVLQEFLTLFPDIKLIAIGKFAEFCLAELGIQAECVRHPANGGANKFRAQMKEILERSNPPR